MWLIYLLSEPQPFVRLTLEVEMAVDMREVVVPIPINIYCFNRIVGDIRHQPRLNISLFAVHMVAITIAIVVFNEATDSQAKHDAALIQINKSDTKPRRNSGTLVFSVGIVIHSVNVPDYYVLAKVLRPALVEFRFKFLSESFPVLHSLGVRFEPSAKGAAIDSSGNLRCCSYHSAQCNKWLPIAFWD